MIFFFVLSSLVNINLICRNIIKAKIIRKNIVLNEYAKHTNILEKKAQTLFYCFQICEHFRFGNVKSFWKIIRITISLHVTRITDMLFRNKKIFIVYIT